MITLQIWLHITRLLTDGYVLMDGDVYYRPGDSENWVVIRPRSIEWKRLAGSEPSDFTEITDARTVSNHCTVDTVLVRMRNGNQYKLVDTSTGELLSLYDPEEW